MKIKFDKLFPGQFGTTVESFFNDKKNNKKFIKDFKPQIQKQVQEHFIMAISLDLIFKL